MRPETLLSLEGVTAGYGGPPILSGISIEVGLGEVVTVVGPNGAGKSTLLKVVLGLLQPASGAIRLNGTAIGGMATEAIVGLGVSYVPQEDEVFSPLSVRENLEMGGYHMSHRDLAVRIDEVTSLFPLLSGLLSQSAGKLSGGERKMVAIASALMARPSLLVLDEPTSGLSPELSTQVLDRDVKQLAGSGVSVLMVEQKAVAALAVSDWSYVLVGGRVHRSSPARVLIAEDDLGAVFLQRNTRS